MDCDHTVTQCREGEKGSWCCKCGVKVMMVHDRPCGECSHYEPEQEWYGPHPRVGFCRHPDHRMRVTAGMHVTYYLEPGPHRHGLCFTRS